MQDPDWLIIARELQAIAQTGHTFTQDAFDQQRYQRIRELAALRMADGSRTNRETVLDLFRQEVGYPTPKVDVRGAAFVDGKVLMVREGSDGRWTLPGGWADVNQAAAECVIREIAEEYGFEGRVQTLAAVLDYAKLALECISLWAPRRAAYRRPPLRPYVGIDIYGLREFSRIAKLFSNGA